MVSAYISISLASVFLAILFLLHFLKRELDPAWRTISEYEIGRFGWMMRLAFFCWGASVLAIAITIWPSLQQTSGTIGRWWFAPIAIALFGVLAVYGASTLTYNMLNECTSGGAA